MACLDTPAAAAQDHVAVFTTLGAGAWVHVLEPFQFELGTGLNDCVLDANTGVGVDLRVRHSDADWALASCSL